MMNQRFFPHSVSLNPGPWMWKGTPVPDAPIPNESVGEKPAMRSASRKNSGVTKAPKIPSQTSSLSSPNKYLPRPHSESLCP